MPKHVALLTEFSNDLQILQKQTNYDRLVSLWHFTNNISRQLKLLHSFRMIDQMSCFVMPLHAHIMLSYSTYTSSSFPS